MSLIEVFVRNPVKVAVGVLLVALFGAIALMRMPMQLTPEVTIPIITVTTVWPGASPQEVEQEIVTEQEEQLTSVEGITKLSSASSDSLGTITMEFQVGTDMEEALLKVSSRLQQVPEYPEDADEPVISTSDSSSAGQAIAWFILSPKYATPEEIDAFSRRHPELAREVAAARNAHNMGVRIMRLRELAKKHEEIRELLPRADFDVTKMRRFVEDEIEARFERVPGVSQSTTFGGLEDELQVVVDPEKLAARRLTLTDVRNVLRSQNEDVSAGDFWEGKRRWVVRAMGQFRSPEQVENQLLAIRDGAPVFVRDVAEVRLGYKKPNGFVRRYGESTIAINASREVGANVLDVMAGLQEAVRDLNRDLLNPRGLHLTQAYDETEYIYSAVDLVKDNIFIGGALTMAVLMLFLHLEVRTLLVIPWIMITALLASWVSPWYFVISVALIVGAGFWFARGALVVGLVIPVSIVGTFVFLEMMGRSLNVISLAGFAFAVGMFIDNAIVVLENIFRRHSLGESPLVATVRGTKEVWGAILAATLTNVAVFAPVIFMQEEAGQLFRDIALAVTGALLLSVVASMTIVPAATARLFRDSNPEEYKHESTPHLAVVDGNGDGDINSKGAKTGLSEAGHSSAAPPKPPAQRSFTERIIAPILWSADLFVNSVVAINRWAQPSVARRLAIVFIMIGTSTALAWLMWPKVEYLPTGNRNLVFGIVLPPPGYNVDKLMDLAVTVEQDLEPYWNVDPDSPEAAELKYPIVDDFFVVAFNRQVFMGLRAHDPMRAKELEGLVFTIGNSRLEGAMAVAFQSSIFGEGLQAGRSVDVEITGPDVTRLVALGGQIFGQSMQLLSTPDAPAQARPEPSLDLSSPEVHIEPKLVQAADMRISTTDLGFTANALIDGAYVSDYFLEGKKIDLTVMGEEQYARTTQDIEALPIATPMGQLVPLSAVADVRLASGPEQINHRERERAITILVTPPATVPLEVAMERIQNEIVQPIVAAGQLEGGYHINLAGTADKLRQAWQAMRFNILLAAIITYLLMAALFESWLYPFVIILTVPLGAVGGVLGLWLLNFYVLQTLDVLTMLGFVILIGTVVNNPILIVHQSLNHMREDGMSPSDAIVESVRTRIRPILMTAVTTVLGLLPLVLFPGAGSELYRGLGAVLLGGLIVSTLLPLVLIPALFSLTMDARQWFMGRLFGREQPVPVDERPAKLPATPHVGESLRESHERPRAGSGLAAPKK
jgi:hydrophobic/amphiphilic exporter-1 (mainly G- bacteria), HAE1 family